MGDGRVSHRRGVKRVSPVAGLGRDELSFVQVLGQSVSAVAPSAVMVTLPVLVFADAGRGAIAVFVATTVLMMAVGYCTGQFSTRMVAVSGLYSFTVKGLGATSGVTSGWSLVIGYASTAMAGILGAATFGSALLGRVGVPDGAATTDVTAVVIGVVAVTLMVRGVRLSARISLTVELVSIVVASTVLIVAFVQTDDKTPSGDATGSGSNVAFAFLLAIMSFVGFESAGTVAREARSPMVAVTRAVRWSPVVLGVLYVFAVVMQLPTVLGSSTDESPFVLQLPDSTSAVATVLSVLMEIGITASWLACVIGATTALSRILFAMGREGVLPTAFGRAHPRFRTPHFALLASMPLIVAVPVVYLTIVDSPRSVLLGLVAVGAHGYVLAYIFLCGATPVFLRRIGELTRAPMIVGTVTALVMVGLVGWSMAAHTVIAGATTVVFIGLLVPALAVYAWRLRRDPSITTRVGVYDEPVVDDLVDEYQPWTVGR